MIFRAACQLYLNFPAEMEDTGICAIVWYLSINLMLDTEALAYDTHMRDPFLKFPYPVGNRRVGYHHQERVNLVLVRTQEAEQGSDLNPDIQLILRRNRTSSRFA